MSEKALSTKFMERFMNGDTDRLENLEVVRGLLLASPAEAGTDPARQWAPAADTDALSAAFDQALASLSDVEETLRLSREQAQALSDEIEHQLTTESWSAVSAAIESQPRFHSWAVSETLRQRSFETGLDNPERAVVLARLAVKTAELSAPNKSRFEHDNLAAAWGQLGNALRIASELQPAEDAFKTAHSHLDQGTGDPLAHAQLLSFEASLAQDRTRFRDGISHCRRALRLYRRVGDTHGQGKMLIQEAALHVDACDVPTAIACLNRAATRVDATSEPRLALVVLHNLISYLDQQERFDEAWQRLEQARGLARRLGHRLDLIRLRWLEGRIAAHRDDDRHAEESWNEARGAFVELGVAYDAALVSLEMSELLARQNRRTELLGLVEEMLPVFQSRSLHREAQTALRLFSEAVRNETAEITHLAREVGEYLEKARHRPHVPFRG